MLQAPFCLYYTFLPLLLFIFCLLVLLDFGPVVLNLTEKLRSKEKAVMCFSKLLYDSYYMSQT